MRDKICTLFGGREAEVLLCDGVSIGSSRDIHHATSIARALVEEYGEGTGDAGIAHWAHDQRVPVSEAQRGRVDVAVHMILEAERKRAAELLVTHRVLLTSLRDLLLEKKVLDRNAFAHLAPAKTSTPTPLPIEKGTNAV